MAKAASERYPPQIKFIIGNEACERFSFYGMRNILTVFLVSYLLLEHTPGTGEREREAKEIFHLFVSGVYFFPLLGGYLADRFFGKYRTILWLSLLYCVGHAFLAFFENNLNGFYAGLFLIALGSGGIKPCVSSFVGDQFDESNKGLVKGVFGLFYWIINFGSFFASLLIPLTLDRLGPSIAFGVPGLLMFVATVIFWLGRKQYVDVPPTGRNPHSFFHVVVSAARAPSVKGGAFLDRARGKHPPEAIEGAKAVLRVLGIFSMIPVFWALFDQKGSTWVLQARQMDLNVMGLELEPSQLQALNPLMVMALIPLLTVAVYPAFEKTRFALTPLRRMTLGMVIAGVSYLCVAAIELSLGGATRPSVLWQTIPYLVLTLAEVLVSTTGLEFAYSQAPREMKGTIMSFWSLTVTVGNLLVTGIARLNVFEGAASFLFFAALIFVAAFVFGLIARRYTVVDYFQKAPVQAPVGEHQQGVPGMKPS